MMDLEAIKADLEPRSAGVTATAGEVKWRGRCRDLVAEVEKLESALEYVTKADKTKYDYGDKRADGETLDKAGARWLTPKEKASHALKGRL